MTIGNRGTAKPETFPTEPTVLFLLAMVLITSVMRPGSTVGKLLDFYTSMRNPDGNR